MLKKVSVLLFTVGLLGISFYGMSNNSYYVQILMNLSTLFIYIRIAIVAILLTYVFVPSIRLYTTRTLLSISGILLVSLGVISLASPSLLGYTSPYILLGDTLTLIEAGIFAIILSAELSAQRSRFIARSYHYVRLLIGFRPRAVSYQPAMYIIMAQKNQLKLKPVKTYSIL